MSPEAALNGFLSRDPDRIMAAIRVVMETRDADVLDHLSAQSTVIEKATKGIDLGGAFIPNRVQLNLALKRLRLYRDGKAAAGNTRDFCYCRLFGDHLSHHPELMRDRGRVEIESEDVRREEYTTIYRCRCVECGAKFRVQEDIGWHVPTYRWEEI